MPTAEEVGRFEKEGLIIVKNVLEESLVSRLKLELEEGIEKQNKMFPDAFDYGMLHNCMEHGENLASILNNEIMHEYLDELISPTCIMYAYQSSSLNPGGGESYASRIHVDSPRFIDNYITNMGVIFPLDDFTIDNGATYYLKGSHRSEEIPDRDHFFENSARGVCKKGDMILFNARVFHAAGVNITENARHSLTINVCRSFMRQRFDFPKLISEELLSMLNENGRRFIGMNVRMPKSLEEFYLPEDQRLYKPNQG